MPLTQTVPSSTNTGEFNGAVAKYVRELIEEQQKNIPEEPLRLAFFFYSDGHPSSVELFEVIDNFGGNRIAEVPELFEVIQEVPAEPDSPPLSTIRMILTNPVEVPVAFEANWAGTTPVRDAIRAGRHTLVHGNPLDPLLDIIRGQ